jgi:hypothetical protein
MDTDEEGDWGKGFTAEHAESAEAIKKIFLCALCGLERSGR